MERIGREGISAPLETLLAYEGLAATLFSGTYPSQHGIWTRYYEDPEGSPFKWVAPFAPTLELLDKSPGSLSKMLRFELMRVSAALAGISYFPGVDRVPFRQLARMNFSLKHNLYERGCFGRTQSLFDILRQAGLSFRYFDHGVFDSDYTVFKKATSTTLDDDVIVVRFLDLDTVSHGFGPRSEEKLRTLRRTDSFVERIVSEWRGKSAEMAVLCFADHGMVPVNRYVDIGRAIVRSGLRPFSDFGMFLDSTMARFWGDDQTLEKIRALLSKLNCGDILLDSDRYRFHIPPSPSWGQLVFLLKPGNAIFPSFFESHRHTKAMHGYDPSTPGLETIFILQSPKDNFRRRFGTVRMVDVLPTVLELLGLKIPSQCSGKPLIGGWS